MGIFQNNPLIRSYLRSDLLWGVALAGVPLDCHDRWYPFLSSSWFSEKWVPSIVVASQTLCHVQLNHVGERVGSFGVFW